MNKNQNPKKITNTMHQQMAKNPENWILIPLTTIQPHLRHLNKKIEDN